LFGKDFGGMAQGCNKTGQKGTNAMFIMLHDDIMHDLAAKKNSLILIPLSITGRKKKIPTAFVSWQGGIDQLQGQCIGAYSRPIHSKITLE
jgi:hypothetical protein